MTAPQPARFRQRFVAGLIDSGSAVGLLGGGAVAALEAWRPHALERLHGVTQAFERWTEWSNSTRGQRAHAAVTVLWTVGMRNARSPGMRVMHIRRVDARTGGPVTLRSALRRAAFQQVWSAGSKRLTHPQFKRWNAYANEMQGELAEVRRNHPDDRQAEAAFYSAQRRGPLTGCCGLILALWAIQALPVVFTQRRQTLSDWVAGTMVARD